MTPSTQDGRLTSAEKQLVHQTRRSLAPEGRGRRLAATQLLQSLDPCPGRGVLSPIQRDERLEFGTGELGHVGDNRRLRKGLTLHASHRGPASCQNDVWTLLAGRVLQRAQRS